MQWRGGRRSSNVSDQRGAGGGFGPFGGGGLGGGGLGGGGFGRGPRIGGLGLVAIVAFFIIASLMGVDPMAILNGSGSSGSGDVVGDILSGQSSYEQNAGTGTGDATTEDELKDFVSVILGSTEDVWSGIFAQGNGSYRQPTLVLFSGATQSACGYAQSAMGPFYCPPDEKVYIDLDFYRDLRSRFEAPGDFAQAYVIAHEVGHHVQNLLGIEKQVSRARSGMSEADANALSVRVELQADCFAGIWAHQIEADDQNLKLEAGDIEEGLQAASAIGDDRLQSQATGRVVPDSFTHGSSAQRVRWFQRGLDTGDLEACDTFNADKL
ncbi:MAG: zinc metallopeptidase [Proteobacteria bacterium]|nr:zinc metallopeptidase [Pseudomonadota bacterium]